MIRAIFLIVKKIVSALKVLIIIILITIKIKIIKTIIKTQIKLKKIANQLKTVKVILIKL